MKFKILRKDLLEALEVVKPIITVSDLQSISDSILFTLSSEMVTLQTTNNITYAKLFISNLAIESISEKITFLIDARKLINIVSTNTTEFLKFNLKFEEEDIGNLTIKGDSTYNLPLRSIASYPEFLEVSNENYKEIDGKEFVDNLILLANFVEKDTIGYNSGVCITGKSLIATDNKCGLCLKQVIPISPVTLLPEISKCLLKIANLKVKQIKDTSMLAFSGELSDNVLVELRVSTIEEKYPYKTILEKLKEWYIADAWKVLVKKSELNNIYYRLKGFVSPLFDVIDITVSENKMEFAYSYDQYESNESIECEYSGESFSFKIPLHNLAEIIKIGEEEIPLVIDKFMPVLLFKYPNLIYFIGLMREEKI